MRQLISRIDDDLHARLKRRAAEEDVSMNALVNAILARHVAGADPRAAFLSRARTADRLVRPPRPSRVPSRAAVARATRGASDSASKALAAERAAR